MRPNFLMTGAATSGDVGAVTRRVRRPTRSTGPTPRRMRLEARASLVEICGDHGFVFFGRIGRDLVESQRVDLSAG